MWCSFNRLERQLSCCERGRARCADALLEWKGRGDVQLLQLAKFPSGAAMVGYALSALPQRPAWLEALLNEKFFVASVKHSSLKKNERNIFCIDCSNRICQHPYPSESSPFAVYRQLCLRNGGDCGSWSCDCKYVPGLKWRASYLSQDQHPLKKDSTTKMTQVKPAGIPDSGASEDMKRKKGTHLSPALAAPKRLQSSPSTSRAHVQ